MHVNARKNTAAIQQATLPGNVVSEQPNKKANNCLLANITTANL